MKKQNTMVSQESEIMLWNNSMKSHRKDSWNRILFPFENSKNLFSIVSNTGNGSIINAEILQ